MKNTRLRAVPKEKGLGKEGLRTTHEEMKYALPTERKISIAQNQCVRQSNQIKQEYSTGIKFFVRLHGEYNTSISTNEDPSSRTKALQ